MKPNEQVGRRFEQVPHKRDIQMISRHMKTCSISLVTRKIKIIRYHYMPTKDKTTDNAKCWQGCGAIGTLMYGGGNAKWYNHFVK